MAPKEEVTYKPKDAIHEGVVGTLICGAGGLAVSAVQNTLTRRNVTGWGVFTRTGGTITLFAAVGGIFGFSKDAAANLREKDDYWNPTIGGFLAGAALGLRFRTFPAVLGLGAGSAVFQGVFDFCGGKFSGWDKDPHFDIAEYKEWLRKNKRRPVEETINDIGEGRGIYLAGYRERRADRIKEKYGIDVPRT